jgi:lipooligosaccharide transport system permease protein
MQLTRGAFKVWRRNFESWKVFAASFLVAAIGNPLLYLLAIGYGLGRYVADVDGVPYAVFLAPGLLAAAAMNSASFETTFGSYTRLAEQHTYEAILATPCSVADIVAGDILWAATKSAMATLIVLAVVAVAGLVPSPLALVVVPVGFLTGCCFGALGMVVTAKARSYNFFDYYFTLGVSVMFFFSGVFFPLSGLPVWAQSVAWCMPLTHAVAVARALVVGTLSLGLVGHVVWLVVATVAVFVLAERLVRQRLIL